MVGLLVFVFLLLTVIAAGVAAAMGLTPDSRDESFTVGRLLK